MENGLKNCLYYFAGLVFLFLAKVKSILQGYTTPKTFGINEIQKSVEYDINIVDGWLTNLKKYTNDDSMDLLLNKSILELGPGSDLGVGLYILSKSAKDYNAIDINNLIKNTPEQFYTAFFKYLKGKKNTDVENLKLELSKTQKGNNERLNYIYNKKFDIVKALGASKIDIVFSNAAFEHFDNINKSIEGVSKCVVSGAKFIVLIDLKTHSRWIRDKDPNNIYRYSKWIYSLFKFSGTPNRVRPYQYKEALEKNGWKDIEIIADTKLEDKKLSSIKNYVNQEFIHEKNQMGYLSVWIYATKI